MQALQGRGHMHETGHSLHHQRSQVRARAYAPDRRRPAPPKGPCKGEGTLHPTVAVQIATLSVLYTRSHTCTCTHTHSVHAETWLPLRLSSKPWCASHSGGRRCAAESCPLRTGPPGSALQAGLIWPCAAHCVSSDSTLHVLSAL